MKVFAAAEGKAAESDLSGNSTLTTDFEELRWFPLPSEIVTELTTREQPHHHGLTK